MRKWFLLLAVIMSGCMDSQIDPQPKQAAEDDFVNLSLETGTRNDDALPNNWQFRKGHNVAGEESTMWYRDDRMMGDGVRFPLDIIPNGSFIDEVVVHWYQNYDVLFDMRMVLVRYRPTEIEGLSIVVLSTFDEWVDSVMDVGQTIDREEWSYAIEIIGAADWDPVEQAVSGITVYYYP